MIRLHDFMTYGLWKDSVIDQVNNLVNQLVFDNGGTIQSDESRL